MPQTILTFDVGTTACKTTLFTPDGGILAQVEQEYPVYHPRPMWAEQDAEDWWKAVVATTLACLTRARDSLTQGDALTVEAIGLSAQRETIVPTNEEGDPIGRAIVWMDRRSTPQAESLARTFGAKALHHRTGMRPDATFTATKLLWLLEEEPDRFRQAASFLQPKDFISLRLTRECVTEPSVASRTMLLDVSTGSWLPDLLTAVGVRPEQLPALRASHSVVGRLQPAAAAALELPTGIPVVAGGGDRCCEALGAGVSEQQAMESTGTTSNLSVAIRHLPQEPHDGILYTTHVLPGQWLAEQGLSTTGAILRWFRDMLGEEGEGSVNSSYEALAEAASRVPPGANGLLLLPFFMGAKATRWDPNARGVMFGLTLDHGQGEVARSIFEGVAYELRACLEVLQDLGTSAAELRVTGGGARTPVWNQIKADITRRRISALRTKDAASLGAMILAGWGIGLIDEPIQASSRFNAITAQYDPDPELGRFYREQFKVYNDLYSATRNLLQP